MVSSDFCQAESISFKPKFGDYLADAKVADAAAGAPIAMMYETDAAGHLYQNETGATLRAATSYFRACLANNADIQDDASSLSKTPMHSSLHSSPGAGLSDSDTLSNHGDFPPLMTDNTGNIHTDNSAHSSIGASPSYLDLLSDSNGHPPFSTGHTPAENFLNSPSRAAPTDSDTLSNPTDHDPTDRTITHNYSVAPILIELGFSDGVTVNDSILHYSVADRIQIAGHNHIFNTIMTPSLAASIAGIRSPSMANQAHSSPQNEREAVPTADTSSPKGVNEASAFISALTHELRDRTHVVSAILELVGLYDRKKIDEAYVYIHVYSILYLNECHPSIHERFTTFLPRQWQVTDLEWLREGIRMSLRGDAPRINAVQLDPPTITWSATPVQYRVLLAEMPINVGNVTVEHVPSQHYAQSSFATQPYAPSIAAGHAFANSPGAGYLGMHQQSQQPSPLTPNFPPFGQQMQSQYAHFAPQFAARHHHHQSLLHGYQQPSPLSSYPTGQQAADTAGRRQASKNVFSLRKMGVPAAAPKPAASTAHAAISAFRNGPAHVAVKPQGRDRATVLGRPAKRLRVSTAVEGGEEGEAAVGADLDGQ